MRDNVNPAGPRTTVETVAGLARIMVRVPGGFLASGVAAVELWAGAARSGEISVVLR